MANNKAALEAGFKKAKRMIANYLFSESIKLCDALVDDAVNKRGFQSFTGNTITSFACGIYQDGRLDYMVASGENMSKPVHAKVRNGEVVWLDNPYEGKPRSTTGRVDIAYDLSGMETSFRILQGFSPNPRRQYLQQALRLPQVPQPPEWPVPLRRFLPALPPAWQIALPIHRRPLLGSPVCSASHPAISDFHQ
jgi:hypothetical protein